MAPFSPKKPPAMPRTGSRSSLVSVGLMPVIAENEVAAAGAARGGGAGRSPNRRSGLSGSPMSARRSTLPPYSPRAYSTYTESLPDRRTSDAKREGLSEKEWFARRGGWRRLALLFGILAVLTIALAVGLTIGLRRSGTPDGPSQPPAQSLFPAGSFTFTTALANMSTACTTNAATWRCYPYTTYAESPIASTSTFFWIITQLNSYTYLISSSDNPFSPSFTNVTMKLVDGNSYNEHYTFTFTKERALVPSGALDATNTAATCIFGQTVYTATIWTRQPGNLQTVSNGTAAANLAQEGGSFVHWPGRVEISIAQSAGRGVPSCMDYEDRPIGSFDIPDGGGSCSCQYSNYDLSASRRTRRSKFRNALIGRERLG